MGIGASMDAPGAFCRTETGADAPDVKAAHRPCQLMHLQIQGPRQETRLD